MFGRSCNACNARCSGFEKEICKAVLRAPYVCNGCHRKAQCRLDKYFYRATISNWEYRTLLVESRNGINMSEEGLRQLDALVSPLILKGQTPYQILANHPEIACSEKTLYNYIEAGALSVRNIDLHRKVKYKPRKQHPPDIKDSGIFEGRTYHDFQSHMASHPDTNVVEMDTVIGCEGSRKVLLTLFFRNSRLMLIHLMPDKSAASVKDVFDRLEKKCTTLGFCSAFPLVLVDRGTEFSNPDALECGIGNSIRASLNGSHPLKLAHMLLGKDTVNAFGLREIPPDEIILNKELLK